jgi:hypothetical protein
MCVLDEAALYEQFEAARVDAIRLSDQFALCARDDPNRDVMWHHVMRQTETARLLLERWLRTGMISDQRLAEQAVVIPLPPSNVS